MAEAEVTIDASKGSLMVRGDQAFVSETLEKFKYIFERTLSPEPQQVAPPKVGPAATNEPAKVGSQGLNGLDAFSNVFDIQGDTISILVSPPGTSMTAQARSLILIYLFARFKQGAEPVPADDIKEQCKAHACFDSKNFAGHLKSQKSHVTVTGTNSSMTARLTVPGRKVAEDIVQALQNAA